MPENVSSGCLGLFHLLLFHPLLLLPLLFYRWVSDGARLLRIYNVDEQRTIVSVALDVI